MAGALRLPARENVCESAVARWELEKSINTVGPQKTNIGEDTMAGLLSLLFRRRATRAIQVPRLARQNEATEDQTASMLPEEFLKIELAQIERNRRALNLSMPATATQIPALAISGGGIRSAVFSLGVLQALADRSALDHFAYISTVSGGSYLGAFHGSLFVPDALRAGDQDTHADV